jgi:O-glycosyl hydrolase
MQQNYSSKWIHNTVKISILILFQVFISFVLVAQTVTVNLNQQAQLIRGFGGINHPTWYSDLNAAERELAFGNGPGQLGLTVLRTYVSDKSSEWGLGMQTAKSAIDHGAYVFASPWNPPASMTITVNGVKRINPNSFGAYAEHLNSYVSYMKNNGVDLYAISTQNEPDYAHDWTEWSPQESVNFIKGHADKIKCRLMTPESFQYRKNVYDPILNDPAALAKISIFGAHLYGTQYKDFPYPLFKQKGAGKELWMTEVYTDSKHDANLWNDGILNQDQHALKVAEHIHHAMVEGEFQTYVFWPLRRYYALIHDGNPDGQGNSPASAGTATKRGYCMAQYSKWVRPGFVRVDATKSPTTNVFVSAYKKDNDVVFVVVNKNTSSKTITINIPNSQVTTWEQYTTSASKNIAKGNNINATTSFQITLDASSVTTFVGKGSSGAPSVTLTSPVVGENFTTSDTITLRATATVASGSISKVEFFNGTTKLGEDASAPYSYSWTNVAAGTYSITAKVTDSNGKTASSSPISIKVNVPQGPYNGTWHTIPGKIELEHFDVGGNGFAYMDSSPGSEVSPTVNFRADEDVDIENCTDVGGGYNIGYTLAGEWLEYSVDVKTPGTYDLDLRVAANGDNRTLSLSMDGVTIANNIAIPNTGGWQIWQTIKVKDLNLTTGKKVMRLTIGATDYVNLNYVTFALTKELKQEPYNGIASSIPGRIEAEHYDLGGEGLAYHEVNTNGNQGEATLRNDEVDIETTQDIDGGYNIAYIMAGEWLEYTVNVTSDGVYDLDLRMAADGDNKTLHIEMDGKDVSGVINVPNTGGWQQWQTVTINGIALTAGEHVMRIVFETDYMNLNYVEFRDVITGVNEIANSTIKIFPNPFKTTMNVNVTGDFKYQIVNNQGLLLEYGSGHNQATIGKDLQAGTYILKVTIQGEESNMKFVKY